MVKKSNIIFFLLTAVVIAIASSYPILMAKNAGVYYAIDPEMAYVSNALSFTKNYTITYADHPGTPTVLMLAGSYVPLRFFTKFVAHQSFIPWSFDNLPTLFFYTRLIMILLFAASVFVFLCGVFKATKSKLASVLALFILGLFPFVFRLSGEVLAESLSFLLISVWLFVFTGFSKNRSSIRLTVLSLISGLAMANKLNNVVVVLASVFLILSLKSLNIKQKFNNLVLNLITIVFGFVAGTWYVRASYMKYIIPQIAKVAGSSGSDAAHGAGLGGFLNTNYYVQSITGFWSTERLASLAFLAILLIFGLLLVKRKITILSPIALLFLSAIFSFLFILKYPAGYYQFPNYLVLAFIGSIFVSLLIKKWIILAVILLTPMLFVSWQGHIKFLQNSISSSETVADYINANPVRKASLWDYAPVTDFMYIWMRGWGSGIFDEQLKAKRPDILELKSDYKTVYTDYSNHKDVFDVCWDKLFIREDRAKVFLDMYRDKKLTYEPIGNTGIGVIGSSHCSFILR